MLKHCGKHDINFPEGGSCWCCEQAKANKAKPEEKPTRVPVATGGGK